MPKGLLVEVMSSYFDNTPTQHASVRDFTPPFGLTLSSKMPVTPKSNEWTEDRGQRCLTRKYSFDSHDRMCDFIKELLDYEVETGHYAKLECEYPAVTVRVKTHDVDDITELDKEYASHCDQVYDDVKHYDIGAASGDYR